MALSGGKGYGPKGAQGPAGPSGPGGNPNDKMGPSKPAAKPGPAPAGNPSGNLLDRMLGYNSIDDRKAAYANSMARGQRGITVPNIPNASIGQILGSGILGAFMPGPGSIATIGGNVISGMNNPHGPYGVVGRGIDSLLGGTPGEIEGNTQVGRVNDQGGPVNYQNQSLLGLSQPTAQTASQPVAPTSQPTFSNPYGTSQWQGGYKSVPGPSQYGYSLLGFPYQSVK